MVDSGLADSDSADSGVEDSGLEDSGSGDSSVEDSAVADAMPDGPDAALPCGDYETNIQPIFDAHCLACHSGSRARRGLRLDSLEALLAGGASGDAIVPCQPDASLLLLKVELPEPMQGHRMPFRATPLSAPQLAELRRWVEEGAQGCVPELTICDDATAPEFAGVASATMTGDDVDICWEAATDDISPASALRYSVYRTVASGAEDYRWTPTVSAAGETCLTVPGLAPDQEYCFAVRAMDEAGNQDTNVVERCVTMASTDCIDFEAVVGPLLERECVHCHSGPDADTRLTLSTYEDVLDGSASGPIIEACDAAASFLSQKLAVSPLWGRRMPADGPPYLGVAETQVLRRWIDEGARSSCADAEVCSGL